MSLTGSAEAGGVLRGKINSCDVLTLSAYGIAVKNGFKGTEEEWLASLKAGAVSEEEIASVVAKYLATNYPVRIAEVNLRSSAWVGSNSPYSQVVTIAGVTPYTQVDLTPSVEQLAVFHDKDLAFVTENEDGVVTVFAIGDKPLNDYTIQVTMKEVSV